MLLNDIPVCVCACKISTSVQYEAEKVENDFSMKIRIVASGWPGDIGENRGKIDCDESRFGTW